MTGKYRENEYKKYLIELKEFCKYGQCLSEETAKEYLKFLVDGICKITKKYRTITKDTSHKVNSHRLEKELTRRAESKSFS